MELTLFKFLPGKVIDAPFFVNLQNEILRTKPDAPAHTISILSIMVFVRLRHSGLMKKTSASFSNSIQRYFCK